MAIYLDANALPAEGQITALNYSVIRALAAASGQRLLVPELVVCEAVGRRRRAIEEAVRTLGQAAERLRRMGIAAEVPAPGDPSALTDAWRRDLLTGVSVVPTPADAAAEALRREVDRVPPTREGRGARDAAIWLTVVASHRAAPEPSFFLSANTKDFADPAAESRLHPLLAAEIADVGAPLDYCAGVTDLVSRLGTPVDLRLNAPALQTTDAARSAVIGFVTQPSMLARLVAEEPRRTVFVAVRRGGGRSDAARRRSVAGLPQRWYGGRRRVDDLAAAPYTRHPEWVRRPRVRPRHAPDPREGRFPTLVTTQHRRVHLGRNRSRRRW